MKHLHTFGEPRKFTPQTPLLVSLNTNQSPTQHHIENKLEQILSETQHYYKKQLYAYTVESHKGFSINTQFSKTLPLALVTISELQKCIKSLHFEEICKTYSLHQICEKEVLTTLASQLFAHEFAKTLKTPHIADIDISKSTQSSLINELQAPDFFMNPLLLLTSYAEKNKTLQLTLNSTGNQELQKVVESYILNPSAQNFLQNIGAGNQFLFDINIVRKQLQIIDSQKTNFGITTLSDLLKSWSTYVLDPKKIDTINLHYSENNFQNTDNKIQAVFALLQNFINFHTSSEDIAQINSHLERIGLQANILPSLATIINNNFIEIHNGKLEKLVKEKQQFINAKSKLPNKHQKEPNNIIANTLLPSFTDISFSPHNFTTKLKKIFTHWQTHRENQKITKLEDTKNIHFRPTQGKGVSLPEEIFSVFQSGVLNIGTNNKTPKAAINFSEGQEHTVKTLREEVLRFLQHQDIFVLEPFVNEATAAKNAEYAHTILGNRKNRIYAINNNKCSKEILENVSKNAEIVDRNETLHKLNWEKLMKDYNLPSTIVDTSQIINNKSKISGLKGIALYAGLIQLSQNPEITDNSMIMFIDSDYTNPYQYNPLLYNGLALYHAHKNNFTINGVNMAKSGDGRNNIGTHQEYARIINSGIEENNFKKFAVGISGASLTWPHSDAFAIRWGLLKTLPFAQDMGVEHVLKTCMLINDIENNSKKVWQVANDVPKNECGVSAPKREWTMMKGLASHLANYLKVLEKYDFQYSSPECIKYFNKKYAGVSQINTYIPDGIAGSTAQPMSNSQDYLLPSIQTLYNDGYIQEKKTS